MHMRDQDERHFRVTVRHDKNYRFISQAHEDGRLHGDPYVSDEPDPVGAASGPSTPALLGSALGHCLSAALLEALRKSRINVHAVETEVDAVVHLGDEGLPRISRVDVKITPTVSAIDGRTDRCRDIFERHCTVTSSVKKGIDVNVSVDYSQCSESSAAE